MTFKHAVEFSSFGCAPRLGLPAAAWGNSTYFTRACARCQTGLSCPSRPATSAGPWRLLSWRHTVPALLRLGSFRLVRSGSLRAVRLSEKACPTLVSHLLRVKLSFPALPCRDKYRALAAPVLEAHRTRTALGWDPSGPSAPDLSGPSVSPRRLGKHYGAGRMRSNPAGPPGVSAVWLGVQRDSGRSAADPDSVPAA